MNRYGEPPDDWECEDREIPQGLMLKVTNGVITDHVHTMVPALHKPVSVQAVARQLNQAYDFGRTNPVRVAVPGYGTYRLGPKGWCVE